MSAEETELLPGALRVVMGGALVRKWGSEEEHYTQGMQLGTVINKLHAWIEPGQYGDNVSPCYLVLFSKDSRMYVVPGYHLVHPDMVKDPGRLFGSAHGLAHK